MNKYIEPIRDEHGYQAALSRVDELWDAEIGTKEADELEVLSLLIADDEAARHPIPPPSRSRPSGRASCSTPAPSGRASASCAVLPDS